MRAKGMCAADILIVGLSLALGGLTIAAVYSIRRRLVKPKVTAQK